MSLSASKSCIIYIVTLLCLILALQLVYHNKAITAESSFKAELEVTKDMIGRYRVVKVIESSMISNIVVVRLDTVTGKVCLMSIKDGCVTLKEEQ